MESTPLTKKIKAAISPMAETMGFEIVRVLMVGVGSGRPTLQIMAEKPDGTMLLDDCSRLSQAVSAILDVEDIVDEAYVLEVSSPGIDRPLTRLKDFERYKGFEARVELDAPVNGQKKFKGVLRGLSGEDIQLETETGVMAALPFGAVVKAKLLLTDALIEHVQKSAKNTGDFGDGNTDPGEGSFYEAQEPTKKKPKFNPKNKQHLNKQKTAKK